MKRTVRAAPAAPKPKKQDPRLDQLLRDSERKFGANAIRVGFPKDEKGNVKTFERLPTGSLALDIALGGGLPLGRFTELSGLYSVGKTTLAMHMVREAQAAGLTCAIVDAEGTIDEGYLKNLGIDTSSLVYSPSEGLEEATQLMFDMQRSGAVHFCVWDSIEASPPTKEYEKEMEDTMQLGVKPKINNLFFRKYMAGNNWLVRRGMRPFTLVGINQIRERIGQMHGDPEFTVGGKGKDHASTIEMRLRRGDWIEEGKGAGRRIVGQVVKFKISKNKTYRRMQTGEFDFYLAENGQGVAPLHIDTVKETIIEGIDCGLIEQRGAWFVVMESGHKCQGLPELVRHLRPQKELLQKFRERIIGAAVGR